MNARFVPRTLAACLAAAVVLPGAAGPGGRAAEAAPHPQGPGFLLTAQSTAKCVGLPDDTAFNRGVPGLALVRTKQIPVKTSREEIDRCLRQAAKDPANPVQKLIDKYGTLLGLTPTPPKPPLHRGRGPRTAVEPILALVDNTTAQKCLDLTAQGAQHITTLDAGQLHNILAATETHQCVQETHQDQSEQPLAHIIDNLPVLSSNGVNN